MEQSQFQNLRDWFSGYCRSFYSSDPADQKNIAVKERHTHKVCANMADIARHLGLDESRSTLAGAVALLHDVGRFPQYQRFRTFRDSISTNHAALGASVLVERNVLGSLPEREQDLILQSVRLHNVFAVPGDVDEEALLLVKMIRDADKLDIWRVFMDYYSGREENRASAVALDLPDTVEYSREALASVQKRQIVHLSALRTLNDFKLLQLAWIFDLNFDRSLQLVLERSVIDGIAAALPRTEEIAGAVNSIRDYVEMKLDAGQAMPCH